jgi:hypothetical protein
MSKLTITPILSNYQSTTQLNNNFNLIATAIENTLSRDGSTPNAMSADLDLNGYAILNVSSLDVSSLTNGGTSLIQMVLDAEAFALESQHWANYPAGTLVPEGNMSNEYSSYSYSIDSATYATASASSAAAALSSANTCALYSSLGLGAASVFDFGLITDAIIVFPTDFGTLV